MQSVSNDREYWKKRLASGELENEFIEIIVEDNA